MINFKTFLEDTAGFLGSSFKISFPANSLASFLSLFIVFWEYFSFGFLCFELNENFSNKLKYVKKNLYLSFECQLDLVITHQRRNTGRSVIFKEEIPGKGV